MATNQVNQQIAAAVAMTITIASLASSAVGVGRQSDEVDLSNAAKQPFEVTIFYKIKQGTSPTGSKGVYFYVLASDGTHRDNAAGASDAAITIGPDLLPAYVAANKASPATGDVLQGSFTFQLTSSRFIIAVVQDTAVALDSTGGNHYIQYVIRQPNIQAAA